MPQPRFAICNETWGDLRFVDTCRRIADAGYDGVEIAPFTLPEEWGKPADKLSQSERAEIRGIAEKAGLSIAGLHWLLVPPPDGLHLTTADTTVRETTARYLKDLADLCADLGGSILVLGSPKQRSIPEGESRADARARFLSTIAPCLETCEKRGVTLCLEPLSSEETNFLHTLAQAREMAGASKSPACKTIFDVKAASTENKPLPELITANADIIAHVHANDANRRGPGFGETAFAPIMTALDTIGYSGWVSVEVFDYSPDPDTIAVKSLETLRAASGSGETA